MRLSDLVAASRAVTETSGRLEKIGHLSDLLKRVPPNELEIAIPFLSGSIRQGRIGVGFALISEAIGSRSFGATSGDVAPADAPSLELREVDATFARVAAASGSGSSAARAEILRALLARATRDEQDFLVRLMFGELRQGALEGV